MALHGEVNYLAILLCGVIAMLLGTFWYSPFLFGKIWLESLDKSEEDLKKDFKPFKTYTLTFISYLVMAFGLAQIMTFMDAYSVPEGIRVAFLCWVGFTVAPMLVNSLFEGKKIKLLGVDTGYHLIVMLVFGTILGAWPV